MMITTILDFERFFASLTLTSKIERRLKNGFEGKPNRGKPVEFSDEFQAETRYVFSADN
jgi:hypothetical protein